MLGTLFEDYSPHVIFRQPPSPEVDKAWEDVTKIEYFGVSAADLMKMGKDHAISASLPQELVGGSEPMYMAELDVQHQLHCLNELRKYAYFDHYYSERFHNM